MTQTNLHKSGPSCGFLITLPEESAPEIELIGSGHQLIFRQNLPQRSESSIVDGRNEVSDSNSIRRASVSGNLHVYKGSVHVVEDM